MNINKPQIHSAGSAVSSIQGQPDVTDRSTKINHFADASPALAGVSQATPGAYQADE